jgi:large-conductance mechanosensitive channel
MLLAQDLTNIQKKAFQGNKIPADIGGIIGNALPYIFGAAGIALLIYLVLGGLQMMTSRGDPKAMQGAQGKITNALIGFVIIIIAFFIVQLLGQLFGLQSNPIFSNTFFGK